MPPSDNRFRPSPARWVAATAVLAALAIYGLWRFSRHEAPVQQAIGAGPSSTMDDVRRFPQDAPAAAQARAMLSRNAGSTSTTPLQSIAARLAKRKQELSQGAPLSGGLVFWSGGEAKTQQVYLVIGVETRVPTGANTAYAITPLLNEDGTVKYHFSRIDSTEKQEKKENLPSVVSLPWEGFRVNGGADRIMAFEPDPEK